MGEAQAAPVGRREQRKREVRERILAAAEALFLEQGFEATTVDQIVEAAEVAQKTFFNHFRTKQAVLEVVASARLGVFERAVASARRGPGGTRERLERTFDRLSRRASETSGLVRDLTLHGLRTARHAKGFGTMQAAIADLLRDGQRAGDVREDHDLEFMAELVVGAYSMVMIQWAKDADYPVRARLRETARFLGEAVMPREGA